MDDKLCLLVVIGSDETGRKELLALHDGHRESSQSWEEVLLDLQQRGLTEQPKLAVGDRAMGFWAAVDKHWPHIRTTNPIESAFATARLRTTRSKNCGSRLTTLTMAFKLMESAQSCWRRLRGYELLADVITGVRFKDGLKETKQQDQEQDAA